jgi:hypothetical protein
LEVDDERLEELRGEPGAELVNFERQRVRPRTTFDIAGGIVIKLSERLSLDAQFGVQNLTNHIFAYNFGNPFEGTHFGFPRMWSGRIRFEIR